MCVIFQRLLQEVVVRTYRVVLAGAAFAFLALTPWRVAGYILVAAALASAFPYSRHRDHQDSERSRGHVQLLLLSAVLVDYVRSQAPGVDLVLMLSGLALLFWTSYEQTVLAAAVKRVEAYNLNVADAAGRVIHWNGYANVAAVVIIGVCAVLEFPAWPIAVAALAVSVLSGYTALDAVRNRNSSRRSEAAKALERYQPVFMVHHSAPPGTEYQVTMWLPYLERLGLKFAIVVREAHTAPGLAAATKAPVLVCPHIKHLDEMIVPSLRAVFYVNNGMKNTHAIRFSHLTHIQLLHGDSDKPTSHHAGNAMMDKIFVAGQAGIDRYAKAGVAIAPEKFVIVGRPQVEQVEVNMARIADKERKTVVYMPTWTGNYADTNLCSLPIGEAIVNALLERDVTVVLRAHPYTDKNKTSAAQLADLERILAEDAARTGRGHIWGSAASGHMSVFECMNRADAMISDVSSVASDFLYSGKPLALTDMVDGGDRFADEFPLAAAAYVLRRDLSNLDQMLDDLLGEDPLEQVRLEMRSYYLGDFPTEGYAEAFVDRAREAVLAEPSRPAADADDRMAGLRDSPEFGDVMAEAAE